MSALPELRAGEAAVNLAGSHQPAAGAVEPLLPGLFAGRANSEEGIRNLETSEPLTVLEILRKEKIALRLDCGGYDQGVIP